MTNDPALICRDELRRQQVRDKPLFGLSHVEVRDPTTLAITFLGKAPHHHGRRHHHERGYELTAANVRILGGRRVRDIRVIAVEVVYAPNDDEDDSMVVTLDRTGDFSVYTLEVIGLDEHGRPTGGPPEHFDPVYSRLPFRFHVDCPADIDCAACTPCAASDGPAVEINYLAKDYYSFRQLMLDRLAVTMPGWTERHVPDLFLALVEVLAYVGDYLSYYQDAVATEAYLRTARRRISVRRHARLIDYRVHDGCNARVWVCLQTTQDHTLDCTAVQFLTGFDAGPADGPMLTAAALDAVPTDAYETFQPLPLAPADGPGPFLPQDILDWQRFLGRLKDPNDAVSVYLLAQFPHHARELVREYPAQTSPSEALRRAVLAELNRELADEFLYDAKRFAGRLTLKTQKLAESRPTGRGLLRLNRWLLRDAYRDPTAQGPHDCIAGERRIHLRAAHNEISFYTWGDAECCLKRGALSATLADAWADGAGAGVQAPHPSPPAAPGGGEKPAAEPARRLHFRPGDVLILGEAKGPATGNPADADPMRRQAVRLTRVTPGVDPLFDQPIVEVEWGAADALRFPLCLSAVVPNPAGAGPQEKCPLVSDISVVWGNVVLADHGKSVSPPEALSDVPTAPATLTCSGPGRPVEQPPPPPPCRPVLAQAPVTSSEPFGDDVCELSASALTTQDPRSALPVIRLTEGKDGPVWTAQADLLSCGPDDRCFVAEMDDDGDAHLRFGDGDQGMTPAPGTEFTASYRVGNGTAGNVGAERIRYVVLSQPLQPGLVLTPRNPLPAVGGQDPEPLDQVRELAPLALRQELQQTDGPPNPKQLERAVTPDDYAAIATLCPSVRRAAATFRWNGSWRQVVVVVEPAGRVDADADLLRRVERFLESYRRIGHEVIAEAVRSVPLAVTLNVCIKPGYIQGQVRNALRAAFSSRNLPGGAKGFFHPDLWDFGQSVYQSALVGAAMAVEGVLTAAASIHRLADPSAAAADGPSVGPLEVIRCDSDPNFPENGAVHVQIGGRR